MAPAAAPPSVLAEPSPQVLETDSSRDGCFLWSCQLSNTGDSHAFSVPDFVEGDRHTLELKQTSLGIDATIGERNVIELEFCDGMSPAQRHILTSLTTGRHEVSKMDFPLTWTPETKLNLKLVLGTGPVFIAGNHHVVTYAPRNLRLNSSRCSGTDTEMSASEMSGVESDSSSKME